MSHVCLFQQAHHFFLAWCRGQDFQMPSGPPALLGPSGLADLVWQLAEPSKSLSTHARYTTNSGLVLGPKCLVLVKSVIDFPFDIHSSKQVRSSHITETQEDGVLQCELPCSQTSACGLMTPFQVASGSAPEWPRQSSHSKFCLAQVQLNVRLIAQNELLSLPFLCFTRGTHQIDVHTLRPKGRMTLRCLYRTRALKHRCLTAGQYVHSFL